MAHLAQITVPGCVPGCLVLALTACVSPPTTDPAALDAGNWALDPAHARVSWQVRHLGLSWYTARFDTADASLELDPEHPENAKLTAIVQSTSVSTGDAAFDETLRSSAWLDAERHPQIVFRATSVEPSSATTARVHGELTLKGVTRDAVMETEFYGSTHNPLEGRQVIGFSGEISAEFEDFGVGAFPATNFIGQTVIVEIEAEFLEAQE